MPHQNILKYVTCQVPVALLASLHVPPPPLCSRRLKPLLKPLLLPRVFNTQHKGEEKELKQELKRAKETRRERIKKKMATVEEPILSRLDRLDNILKKLEEVKGSEHSPKTSTASSETLTSDGQASSLDFSPRSMEKHCRPIDDVITETEHKGTLIERLVNVENRVLNMCLQLEAELEKKREENVVLEETMKKKKEENVAIQEKNKSPYKKGLKSFVKYCVKGKHKHNKE